MRVAAWSTGGRSFRWECSGCDRTVPNSRIKGTSLKLRRYTVIGNDTGRDEGSKMSGLIYLVGLIVVVMFILSFLGLH